ncbi:hypothetical protein SCG7109_AS_00130 [Chlamydiales bacterium SCGC AG-110-M15]|nr:hypothetical protein SCG7109_AS_00130 [Chlamydiales bacterium SCGC AG-110-M15]
MVDKPKILLVEDDADFFDYLSKTLDELSISPYISITHCRKISSARDWVKKGSFLSFIIDAELPDGKGIDLIKWIYGELGMHSRIAFIASKYTDEVNFKKVRDQFESHSIIHRPLIEEDKGKLFKFCIDLEIPEELVSDPTHILIKKDRYRKLLPKIFAQLKLLVQELTKTQSKESLNRLKEALNLILNGANSNNFRRACAICNDTIKSIEEIQKADEDPHPLWLQSLEDNLLDELTRAFHEGTPLL